MDYFYVSRPFKPFSSFQKLNNEHYLVMWSMLDPLNHCFSFNISTFLGRKPIKYKVEIWSLSSNFLPLYVHPFSIQKYEPLSSVQRHLWKNLTKLCDRRLERKSRKTIKGSNDKHPKILWHMLSVELGTYPVVLWRFAHMIMFN